MAAPHFPICFVSQAPLRPGAPVKLLPIRPRAGVIRERTLTDGTKLSVGLAPSARARAGTAAFWQPHADFLDATISAQGGFDLAPTPLTLENLPPLLRKLQQHGVRATAVSAPAPFDFHALGVEAVEALREREHRLLPSPTDAPPATWSALQACWAHLQAAYLDGDVILAGPSDPLGPLDFAVMHQATFDKLVHLHAATPAPDRQDRELYRFLEHLLGEAYTEAQAQTPSPGRTSKREFEFRLWHKLVAESAHLLQFPHSVRRSVTEAYLANREQGTPNQADIFRGLRAWLECAYALAALCSLQLPLSPVAYRATAAPGGNLVFEQLVIDVNDSLDPTR